MLKTAEIVPFLRKKTVRFADDESLLLPRRTLLGQPERWISRGSRRRLPSVLLRMLALLVLLVVVTVLLVQSSGGGGVRSRVRARPARQSYTAWLAGLSPEQAAAVRRQRTALFRGEPLRWNDSAPAHVPWPGDPDCRHFVTRFSCERELPAVALVSLPGSGATWLRYLIEGATGIFTGSVHHDAELYDKGLLGELNKETDGSTIVQQTHRGPHVGDTGTDEDGPAALEFKIPKVVLLLRNPYRALLHARGLEAGRRDQLPPSSLVRGPRWRRFVDLQLQQWRFKLQLALGISERVHVLHYEELQEDTEAPLLSLLEFLELSPPDRARLSCLRSHPDGPTRRSFDAAVVAEYAYSEPELRRTVNAQIDAISEVLQEHGLELPFEKYEMYGKKQVRAQRQAVERTAEESLENGPGM